VQDIRNATTTPTVADQVINWRDNIWGGSVTLASYQDGEAAGVFTDLKRLWARAVRTGATHGAEATAAP
jgi:hypothetical protein